MHFVGRVRLFAGIFFETYVVPLALPSAFMTLLYWLWPPVPTFAGQAPLIVPVTGFVGIILMIAGTIALVRLKTWGRLDWVRDHFRDKLDEDVFPAAAFGSVTGVLPWFVFYLGTSVKFFSGCAQPTPWDYYLYVLDCLAKGALFDLMESYSLSLYTCEPNAQSFVVSTTTFVLRVFSASVIVWAVARTWRRVEVIALNRRWRNQPGVEFFGD